ncbi:MAG: anti-sigma factor [Dehalococcoidia bacterium]|nr:anti-sigma factor [Dehalococcoidia bacterium]
MLEHRDCAEIDEMLPAYAMGALDDADRVRVDSHLVSCDRHEDAFAWGEVALRLADLAPEVTPPEVLRERILAIPSGPPVPVAAPVEIVEPAPEPIRVEVPPAPVADSETSAASLPIPVPARQHRLPYALAAVFAALTVLFGAWTAILLTGGGEEGEPMLVAENVADGLSAKAMFMADESVIVVKFDGLTSLPEGSAYQLWATEPGGDATSAGMLEVTGGSALASMEHADPPEGWTFAVTIEPAGGSATPTNDPVVAVTF